MYMTLPGDKNVPKAAGGMSDERPLKKTQNNLGLSLHVPPTDFSST